MAITTTLSEPPAATDAGPASSGGRRRWLAVLRTPVGASAGLLLMAVLLLAVLGPLLWGDRADAFDTDSISQGPSAAHWAGTDNLGRDLLLRVLVATRPSVGLALLATLIAVVVGLLLGTAPLLLGRRAGRLVTAVVNIAVAFPGLLLALFFAVIFGVGMTGAVLAIGFAGAPTFARLSQTLAAGIAQRDFIAAARIAGVGRVRLLLRHVLPNIGEPLVVNATIGAGGALLSFAGLSFLGLGVQAPAFDWGRLLQDGLTSIYLHPAAALVPGAAIVVVGLAFNLFGESVAKVIGLAGTVGRVPLTRRSRRPGTEPVETPVQEAEPAREGAVLDVHNLAVTFPAAGGPVQPVRGVSFTVGRGEAVGVVGESGSGKSLTALAIAQLIEEPGVVTADRLRFLGTDLLAGTARTHRGLLGTSFAMVFQDPMTSFNPTRRIGAQLAEVARQHQGMTRGAALARAVDRLRGVRVPAAERRARQYPHEFSGGMRQRAMIGMGLMGTPALIVADEPTTALDVTVQRQVLDLLQSIRVADDVGLLLISHDVAVVRQVCDRVLVMYAGRVVEDLPVADLTTTARHPYTRALAATVPDMSVDLARPLPVIPGRPVDPAQQPVGCAYAPRCPLASDRCTREDPALAGDGDGRRVACWHAGESIPAGQPGGAAPIQDTPPTTAPTTPPTSGATRTMTTAGDSAVSELRFEDVTVRYGNRRRGMTAVDSVSLTVPDGAIVGLVGESGSGKSTLARAAVGLTPLSGGRILLDGQPLRQRAGQRPLQMVFQDPYSSLDPRMTIGDSIAEAVPRGSRPGERRLEVGRLLQLVELDPARAGAYPAQLSGGQRQRVALARALAGRPGVVIADEITSALDVSIQGTVLNLVRTLQRDLGMSMLFISHNLAVVRYVATTIAVMYLGRIVEHGPAARVLGDPQHPYTRDLLAAVPDAAHDQGRQLAGDPALAAVAAAEPADPHAPPSGCHYHPRCPIGPLVHADREICRTTEPSTDHRHASACHFAPAAGSAPNPPPAAHAQRGGASAATGRPR